MKRKKLKEQKISNKKKLKLNNYKKRQSDDEITLKS